MPGRIKRSRCLRRPNAISLVKIDTRKSRSATARVITVSNNATARGRPCYASPQLRGPSFSAIAHFGERAILETSADYSRRIPLTEVGRAARPELARLWHSGTGNSRKDAQRVRAVGRAHRYLAAICHRALPGENSPVGSVLINKCRHDGSLANIAIESPE